MLRLPDTPYADMTAEERAQATTFARDVLRAAYEHFVSESVASLRAQMDSGELADARELDEAMWQCIERGSQLQSSSEQMEAVHFSREGLPIRGLRRLAEMAVREDLHAQVWPQWRERLREQRTPPRDDSPPSLRPKA